MSPSDQHLLGYPVSKQELPVFPDLAWGCCIRDFLRRVPLKAASSQVPSCARSLWKQSRAQDSSLLLAVTQAASSVTKLLLV